ncbi:modification methylase [Streptacidiphilus sp. MAP12-16]|uniref:TRM11 family SAM-dependent methyltransferase n=1 Tax=Streptacidiphilus sp. MAP12-16 TaxID=3156300 RepID=UPI003518719B
MTTTRPDTADPAPITLASLPTSVWVTAQQDSRTQRRDRYLPDAIAHPGKMLPAIARHAITTYTRPGDTVLDPMCGIGTSLVEAVHAGRHAVGVELEPKWAFLARANLQHAYQQGAPGAGHAYLGDARRAAHLIGTEQHGLAQLLLTSPPYGNSLHGQLHSTRETGRRGITKFHDTYGNSPGNLASAPTDDLLTAFTAILTGCRALLADGATVAVTARPWREHGEFVDLPAAVIGAGRAAGLVPVERCVALLAAVRDEGLVARPSFYQLKNIREARAAGVPMHLIVHEDVLIFRNELTSPPARERGPAAGPTPVPAVPPARGEKWPDAATRRA